MAGRNELHLNLEGVREPTSETVRLPREQRPLGGCGVRKGGGGGGGADLQQPEAHRGCVPDRHKHLPGAARQVLADLMGKLELFGCGPEVYPESACSAALRANANDTQLAINWLLDGAPRAPLAPCAVSAPLRVGSQAGRSTRRCTETAPGALPRRRPLYAR